MMKIGVADYGMFVWEGGLFDYEQRLRDIKAIGYDGLERLRPVSESDAINTAAMVKKLGMDFATCLSPTAEKSIQWTAALGKEYVWADVSAKNFDDFCRQVNVQARACERYGIRVALHNHLGSLVETQEQLDEFMRRCPDAGLLLDTGHLAVAGGDALMTASRYYDRLVALHLKCWVMKDKDAPEWYNRGYFTGLDYVPTEPNAVYVPNAEVVALLKSRGFDKWIMVEHDTHLREPLEDLAESRKWMREHGI